METAASNRRYGGMSGDERRALRRQRLVESAIALYGEQGFRQTSVKAVCLSAGLSERYFYEAFSDPVALLAACFDTVANATLTAMRAAAVDAKTPRDGLRRLIGAYYQALVVDRRQCRVFAVEIWGIAPSVDHAVEQWIGRVARLLDETAGRPEATSGPSLLAIGAVGAIIHIGLAWASGAFGASAEEAGSAAMACCEGLLVS